jgi:hypothetical protein
MAKLEGSETLGLCIEYKQCFRAMRCCVWDANKEERVIKETLERQPKPHTLPLIVWYCTYICVWKPQIIVSMAKMKTFTSLIN